MTRWIAVIAIGLIAGCATTSSPVPEGYSGPLAMIKDTVNQHSTSKADFFCLAEIDGRDELCSRGRQGLLDQGNVGRRAFGDLD
ncbi:MAG TPA: hypothetical protein VGR01_12830 [Burkholderiales bacterium]|nr:hypothetical protein [Burkholderiales bacterium]